MLGLSQSGSSAPGSMMSRHWVGSDAGQAATASAGADGMPWAQLAICKLAAPFPATGAVLRSTAAKRSGLYRLKIPMSKPVHRVKQSERASSGCGHRFPEREPRLFCNSKQG